MPPVISVAEACEIIGISRTRVDQLIRSRRLRRVGRGPRVWLDAEEVDDFAQRQGERESAQTERANQAERVQREAARKRKKELKRARKTQEARDVKLHTQLQLLTGAVNRVADAIERIIPWVKGGTIAAWASTMAAAAGLAQTAHTPPEQPQPLEQRLKAKP